MRMCVIDVTFTERRQACSIKWLRMAANHKEENPGSNLIVYSTLRPKFLCPLHLSSLSCGVYKVNTLSQMTKT
jgi:hypothetical protein